MESCHIGTDATSSYIYSQNSKIVHDQLARGSVTVIVFVMSKHGQLTSNYNRVSGRKL